MGWFGWFSRTNRNDGKRLREWRTAWAAAADAPGRAETEALRARLVELGLEDDEHEIEREMLEGLESLAGLTERMGAGSPPTIETGHRAVGPDACYFSAHVSLPDDPAQPTGTLLLTEYPRDLRRRRESADHPLACRGYLHAAGARRAARAHRSPGPPPAALQHLWRRAARRVPRPPSRRRNAAYNAAA